MPIDTTTDAVLEREVFWERHKTEVMIALVAILLAAAAFGGYRLYSERRASTAGNLLAAAKTSAQFQKVIADYPSTPAGASAYLLLADAQRSEQKYSEANATLETFLRKFPKHELAGTARLGIAGNLEALGQKDEALAAYQKLAASEPKAFAAPVAMYSQIHLLKEKNQIAEARRICETIITQYRESRFAPEATYLLRTLKLPAQPAVSPSPSGAPPSAPPPSQTAAPSAAAPPAPNAPAPSGPPKKP
ncbi:MAG TPA: tetratricopeptide repeat protein [Chthoniobacterales bacterium]|jgi:tetratricopeptide (TPR) repeat protein|nr:tetratricopeptide repeat protein [Chthoniobacterales bacterium]